MDVILTGPLAIGTYLLASQALICTYVRYHARDFDTRRVLCIFLFP